jgi:hypothetical protein
MRRIALTLLSIGLLASSVATARAQSLYGPGGLFLHPTADVPPKGRLTGGVLALEQRIPSTPGLHEQPVWLSGSLDYGATEDIEIGITGLAITDFKTSWGGSFKYRFLHESASRPAVAAGFAMSGWGGSDGQQGFVAARKQLNRGGGHPIIGHLGLLYLNDLAGLPYHQLLPYAGVEYGVARRLTLIGEFRPRGKSDFKTSTALSLSWEYARGGRLVVTWANTGQSTQPRFGVGVGILMGGRR